MNNSLNMLDNKKGAIYMERYPFYFLLRKTTKFDIIQLVNKKTPTVSLAASVEVKDMIFQLQT